MTAVTIHPIPSLKGKILVPGDKSISHRALLFASVADGSSHLKNLLLGEDVLATMKILQELGVKMSHQAGELKAGEELVVCGRGLHGLRSPKKILDCGNSGTTMRLLLGLLTAQSFESVLTGDDSLNKRPMDRVTQPLTQMGARFDITHEGGKRYIRVKGLRPLKIKPSNFKLKIASAQLKSALLLAALSGGAGLQIAEPMQSRDHTENMLRAMGANLQVAHHKIILQSGEALKPLNITVPGDFSSAAFFIVGALILPGSKIQLQSVGLNPTRTALLDVLKKMGGNIITHEEKSMANEAVGTLVVTSSQLRGADIAGAAIPRLIDEIPIFAIAAAQAQGTSVVADARELRVKESDRIAVLCEELGRQGVAIEEKADGFKITGGQPFAGGSANSHGDHRIAMSLVIAGLRAVGPLTIQDTDCINTSYPQFFQHLAAVTLQGQKVS